MRCELLDVWSLRPWNHELHDAALRRQGLNEPDRRKRVGEPWRPRVKSEGRDDGPRPGQERPTHEKRSRPADEKAIGQRAHPWPRERDEVQECGRMKNAVDGKSVAKQRGKRDSDE